MQKPDNKSNNFVFFLICAALFFLFPFQLSAYNPGNRTAFSAFSIQNWVISGYVRDATSGEALSAATLRLIPIEDSLNGVDKRWTGVENTSTGVGNPQTQTNDFGFYSLSVPTGTYRLSVSRVGYSTWESESFRLSADTTYQISLQPAGQLEEVVVQANRAENQLNTPIMGLSRVDVSEISQVPVLFGEKDVLKTIQLLPGVMSGGEGSSQFFVRGGMGDQNLILLDGATVFNASHLFGFFSTFNSDAIRDVDLYKGGQPAQYGGRLASVLDIRMLEGNNKEFRAEGGVGLIASRLKVEGPLIPDRASFMISGRRTYADLFLKLSADPDINQSQLYFYDLNLKANYQLDDRNTLYLSGYFGEDILGYADVFRFGWGNSSATLRWNHLLSNRLFSNTTAVYSDYDYQVDLLDEKVDFVIASSIRSANLKQDFQFFPAANQTLRFGAEFRYQQIQPSEIQAGENASVNTLEIEKQKGVETSAYISHEWDPLSELGVIYGLRATHFSLLGTNQTYISMEPRLSINLKLNRLSSIKASYSRNSQFLHQLTNTTSSLPTDAWIMSSERVKPQLADQYSLGYYRNFSADLYEFSMEAYYKDMQHQIDYRDAADLQANARVEEELVFGIGRSYGVEWYLKKQRGRWNGWISYALSKSERKFEAINGGQWFHARQDRTHDLSAVLIYEWNKSWNLSATFVYATGHAVTWPSGKYQVGDQTLFYYTERNGYRMPDYHRLDLGLNWEPKSKRSNKRFTSGWSFGLFNAYNRKNAYIIDFRDSETQAGQTEVYRIALFGAIPAITWNFKF